ncbi:hypothetical protein [Microbacterium sp. G2-8]|uniref:hypothetical protein n=1 Tax=Microbacterium sp. G2-8 TaxID=2842454 RepID=UPI001C88EEF0|nr:hypothetical protein [Microbacterium sp. G2-8]
MDRWPWHLSSAKAWPASGTTVKTGVVQLLSRAEQSGVSVRWNAAPGVTVSSSAFTRRADLERVSADLTGAEVTIDGAKLAQDDATWIPSPARDEVVSRTTGTLGEKRFRADPVTVNGYEVRASATISKAPIDWVVVRKGDALLGTFDLGHASDARTAGDFRFSMRQEDLADLVFSIVAPAMKQGMGWLASLSRLKLAVRPTSEQRFVLTVGAAGRAWFLPMSVRVGLDVEAGRDGTITIHRATAASRNLLTKLLILPLRPRLRELAGRTERIGDDDLRVADLSIDASHGRLTASGRFTAR